MIKASMGSNEKCRTEGQPGSPGDASGAPQTLHSCSSHKGFGVINEDFEFWQLMS